MLEEAEALVTNGTVSLVKAQELWASACSGRRDTEIAKHTLSYILGRNGAEKRATLFFKIAAEMVGDASKSYYKSVWGTNYDRALLRQAVAESVAGNGSLGHDAVQRLWASAHDGTGVTEVEARTLRSVCELYPLSDKIAEKTCTQIVEKTVASSACSAKW